MAELILVRHGQASFGADDYDKLSELGWRQSRWLGEYFAERRASFDRVIRGSLRRHAETLAGIEEGMKLKLSAAEDAGLDEYDSRLLLQAHLGGSLPEGNDRKEHFRQLRAALYAWTDDSLALEPQQRFDAFRRRVLGALASARAAGATRALVVSSGGPISTILADVLGMPGRGVVDLNLRTRNTGVTEFHFNERAIHCVSFNAVPHLDQLGRSDAITYS